jgi:hypothetical protein
VCVVVLGLATTHIVLGVLGLLLIGLGGVIAFQKQGTSVPRPLPVPGPERWWQAASSPEDLPPNLPVPQAPLTQNERLVMAGVLIMAVVSGILSQQSVSLLTGTGLLWLGLALAVGAVILAFVVGTSSFTKAVAVIAVVVCLISLVRAEQYLSHQRQQISNIFGGN